MVLGLPSAFADDTIYDEQQLTAWRDTFRAVRPEVERGNWSAAEQNRDALESYVLWPDLRATWFKASVATASHADIDAFLDRHGILKPARELRYRYALHLAGEDHLGDYLNIYRQYYQGLEIAQLDCIALQAELEAGREDRIVSRALDLWMVGRSQADECDPVFANLRARQVLTTDNYAERFQLAIENRNFTLARFLSRPLDPAYRAEANTWLSAQENPRDFVSAADIGSDSPIYRQQLAFAVKRIAYREPLTALSDWEQLRRGFGFTAAEDGDVSRYIALWSARQHQPEAVRLLADLPPAAANVETGRWLVRANLLQHDWPEVVRSIDALPPDEGSKSEWQYWRAVALEELGNEAEASAIFEAVSADRGYHGFLAADALDKAYSMGTDSVDGNPAISEQLRRDPQLVRARELFFVGLESRGRSEWDAVVSLLTPEEQLQAALLAHDWGWHSRAISTVAAAGQYDDLEIRYPLPWRQQFTEHAKTAGIADSWAYGVARSESLFMRDIRSSAGAIGIMQLMPATGRSTAREIKLQYSGLATLTDSTSNIRLGTHYLGKMYDRFDDNRVLATAAYNAGPHRVDSWLPASGSLDARIWIANIPFNETRGYVRRVLTDEAIFYWRMTGTLRRISAELPHIVTSTSTVSSN